MKNFTRQHNLDGKYLYIIFLGVARPFRGKGIGSRLVEQLSTLALERKLEEIHLVAKDDLTGLYGKLGFEITQSLPGFLDSLDGVLMKKTLNQSVDVSKESDVQ